MHPLHICQLSEDIPYTWEMPWQSTDAMKGRVKFVLAWEKRWQVGEGRLNFAEPYREFGISRPVGYEWGRRYRASHQDVQSINARSSPAAESD